MCPLCYYDSSVEGKEMVSKFTKYTNIPVIIFAIVFLGILYFIFTQFLSIMDSFNKAQSGFPNQPEFNIAPIFYMIFGLMLIVILFFVFLSFKGSSLVNKSMQSRENKAEKIKEEFLRSIDDQKFVSKYKSDFKMHCFQCGEVLTAEDLFCPSCGDSTADEKAEVQSK